MVKRRHATRRIAPYHLRLSADVCPGRKRSGGGIGGLFVSRIDSLGCAGVFGGRYTALLEGF